MGGESESRDDTNDYGVPFWARQRFLNVLSSVTFVVLAYWQYDWWRDHGQPFSWMLLLCTPLLAFAPSGAIAKLSRTRWTARWAAAHGFSYYRKAGWPVPAWDFPPFTIARARRFRVRDGMQGRVGAYPARFFHLTWLHNNKINVSTHYRNIFVLELPAALPRLTVGPNLDPTTGTRVQFESADFDEHFSVYCSNPAYAHAVFGPRTLDRLTQLEWGHNALTKFEIAGDRLVAITIHGNLPHQIGPVFDAMRIIADGIPRFVWNDYGTPAPAGHPMPVEAATRGRNAE